MGMVNRVVPHAELETVGLEWAKMICGKSPTAQRMLKFAFNAIDDGLIGQQVFAGEATRLAYMTDEAVEGRDAFLRSVRRTGRPSRTTTDFFGAVRARRSRPASATASRSVPPNGSETSKTCVCGRYFLGAACNSSVCLRFARRVGTYAAALDRVRRLRRAGRRRRRGRG